MLAVAAGGRCEFAGCNEFLFEHPLTLKEGNFSEYAHIVAFSEDGPRGREGMRPRNIDDTSNLMLLCRRDHKLVDSRPTDYSRETLDQYKREHEERIRHVTGLGPDMKTTVVQFKALISGDAVEIPATQIYAAVAPRYPTDKRGMVIDLTSVTTDDESFIATAKGTIQREVQKLYAPGMDTEKTRHISLFALGPIPLLAFLGSQLSNKIAVDLYQRHRDNEEPSPWQWRAKGTATGYAVSQIRKTPRSKRVAMVLSLSGSVDRGHLPRHTRGMPIYEITLKNAQPNVHFLRHRTDLEGFRKDYRELLGRIVREHPRVKEIHVFPAVPAPVAVALGHDLLPKVHPTLSIYDADKNKGGFVFCLRINEPNL